MDIKDYLSYWERGARDFGLGYDRPPFREGSRAYRDGYRAAHKAWTFAKREKNSNG